jgi:hypothetical protein
MARRVINYTRSDISDDNGEPPSNSEVDTPRESSIAKRKPGNNDKQDHNGRRPTYSSKAPKTRKTFNTLIHKYEDDAAENPDDDHSGDTLRLHTDEIEEGFTRLFGCYTIYVDRKFSNKGESRHRKRRFLAEIAKEFGARVEFDGGKRVKG